MVLKIKKPNHPDGTFLIRGMVAGNTIEKIYPLSFPAFEKVLLLDESKTRRAKLYYLRTKVGKKSKLKSTIDADRRGLDLLAYAKDNVTPYVAPTPEPVTQEETTASDNAPATKSTD
jgi:hypothetical protein